MKKRLKNIAMILSTLSFILIGCGGGENTTSSTLSPTQNLAQSSQIETKTESVLENLSSDQNGQITTIESSGTVKSIALSKEALFLAEGKDGVEILKIGYDDIISTEILQTINDINAKEVTLSDDEQILYVEDETGYIQVYDISNLSQPTRTGQTTQLKIDNAALSGDGSYKFIPRGEDGLDIVNISNPSNIEVEAIFNKSNVFDVVLVDDDSKALVATGIAGINLLDISNPQKPVTVANYLIRGSSVTSISLNATNELLFVAIGDKGVLVFNVEILLHKLGF